MRGRSLLDITLRVNELDMPICGIPRWFVARHARNDDARINARRLAAQTDHLGCPNPDAAAARRPAARSSIQSRVGKAWGRVV